jgi:hypothetical protein
MEALMDERDDQLLSDAFSRIDRETAPPLVDEQDAPPRPRLSFGVIGASRSDETVAHLYGIGAVASGNDAQVQARGAVLVAAGNNLTFSGTSGVIMAGNDATIHGNVGLLVAGKVTEGNVRVLLGAPAAAAFGAAFGTAVGLAWWLLRR